MVHAHPYAAMAVYFGIWALFLGGLVFGASRARKRERD